MNTDPILCDVADGVMTIRLNRPDKKNALTQAMYTQLAGICARIDQDPAVRSVLLTGTPDCFCSGNDMVDFLKAPATDENAPVLLFMLALARVAKPVVAALNGPAIGVGTTLLLHVDLAYAGESTRFQMPFVNIGICPEYASTYLLPRMIGHVQAAELLLLGEPFTAATALDARLINAVLPDGEVLAHARAQAVKLAQKPPAALRTSKALLKHWRGDFLREVILHEARYFGAMLHGEEAKEALNAFVQKRKPDFSRFS